MSQVLQTYHEAVTNFKRELLRSVLAAHGGNRTRAARALGLQRTYLLRLLREFALSIPPPARQTNRQNSRE
jgi:DNA-binding NtrC family response regulator